MIEFLTNIYIFPLIGVLLNKVNMKRAAQYYGAYSAYYAYGYGNYVYGDEEGKTKKETAA